MDDIGQCPNSQPSLHRDSDLRDEVASIGADNCRPQDLVFPPQDMHPDKTCIKGADTLFQLCTCISP